ncbi:MAG: serine/threonine-protein kinase [Planctomycetota bacterium]
MRPGALLCDGGYRVIDELGRGGVGAVLRAEETSTGRQVALKLLLDEADAEHLERFRREGEIAARLNHPGIVRLYASAVAEGGRPLLVYELVEGASTLDERLPALPRAERLRRLLEVARALAHAHARGVVHRDVKPANVLIDAEGRARLTDFGLASAQGLDRLTRTGAMLGTPYYMSPEQLGLCEVPAGPPSDVWALGVILYEALTGERPFDGATILELTARVARGPRPPRRVDRSVPRALEAVCLRALSQRPAGRQPDAGAFAAELEAALHAPPPRPRLALAGLGVAALLALSALLAARADRAPPAHPEPAPGHALATAKAAASPAGAPPAWQVAPGDGWRLELRWLQRKLTAEGQERRRAPGLFLAESRVEAVERGVARLRCRLVRFQIELVGDNFPYRFDSATAPETDPIRRLVPIGGDFELRLQVADGAVVAVSGLEALLLERSGVVPAALFSQAFEMLFRLRDDVFREQLDGLFHVPPPGEHAAELVFQDHFVKELAIRCKVRRAGDASRTDEVLEWRPSALGKKERLLGYERKARVSYSPEGRYRSGELRLRARVRDEDEQLWDYEWDMSARLLPLEE